ncbi:cell division protein ZapA [Pelagibacteraceae bacterium]|nr:cell division protein ZapA [Pelagibacteraceae bacterium]
MANVNIKFNSKDYLLSCDDGQEESLKKLTSFLNKKYDELKSQLGNIGENKLLLITTIKLIDDYFNLKQKVTLQKNKLDDLSKKFIEMKSLAVQYKESKDIETNNLNSEIDKFKTMIEETNKQYELILDKTTDSLQNIIKNTESKTELQ